MFPFNRHNVLSYPVGVDIGFDAVRMLQLESAPGGLGARAAVAAPLPPGAADDHDARVTAAADVVRRVLRSGPFRGRRVVAALPREMLHLRTLRLPPTPDADLAWAVRADARDLFPFDPAQATLQFLDAGDVRLAGGARRGAEVRREVIVAAAGDALVEAFVGRLHGAGAVVDSVDAEPCAVFRAHARAAALDDADAPGGGRAYAAVDVGYGRSQVVVGKGRRVRVIKPIEVGGRHVNQAVARKLGVSEAEADQLRRRLPPPAGGGDRDPVRRAVCEAGRGLIESLAREAALCLRYHAVAFRGPGPARVGLSGTEAWDPQFQSALAAALGCPVGPAEVFRDVDTSRMSPADLSAGGTAWSVALGLALRRVPADAVGGPHAECSRPTPASTADRRPEAALA